LDICGLPNNRLAVVWIVPVKQNSLHRGNLRDVVILLAAGSAPFFPAPAWLIATALIVLAAASLLRILTKATLVRNEVLCTDGVYSLVRHPYYLANFLVDAALCLLSGNIVLVFLYPFLFFWAYAPALRDEERILADRFGNEHLNWSLAVPQVLPSSNLLSWLAHPLRSVSRSRITAKELGRVALAWSAAALIILVHGLLAGGLPRTVPSLPILLLALTAAILFVIGQVLMRWTHPLTAIADDVDLLAAAWRDGRPDPALDRIAEKIDRYAQRSPRLREIQRFFEALRAARPGSAPIAVECSDLPRWIDEALADVRQHLLSRPGRHDPQWSRRIGEFRCERPDNQPIPTLPAVRPSHEPVGVRFALYQLVHYAMIHGRSPLQIAIFSQNHDPAPTLCFRVSFLARHPLPEPAELRERLFHPARIQGPTLGLFLARRLIEKLCRGRLDLAETDTSAERLTLDLQWPTADPVPTHSRAVEYPPQPSTPSQDTPARPANP